MEEAENMKQWREQMSMQETEMMNLSQQIHK